MVRPSRPITLPTSSGATFSSKTLAPSTSLERTSTRSGRSTRPLTRYVTRPSSEAGKLRLRGVLRGLLDQRGDRLRRDRAELDPVVEALLGELDLRRAQVRVVRTDRLDEL